MVDAAIVGAGMAGMAAAARLQARGLSTLVLEAHSHIGGCAGYYRRRGFSFDVGATTLVDFEPGGVGGQLLEEIGMSPLVGRRCRATSPGFRIGGSCSTATPVHGGRSDSALSAPAHAIAPSGDWSTRSRRRSGRRAGRASGCRSAPPASS